MTSIHAYYDGRGYVTQDAVEIKPNQRVIITLFDDYVPTRNKKSLSEIKIYMKGATANYRSECRSCR